MSRINIQAAFIVIVLMFASCANYHLKYAEGQDKWDQNVNTIDENNLAYKVILIGDAGNAPMGQSTPLFDLLADRLSYEKTESAIVWLGDNIYRVGLAPPDHPTHALGNHRITSQAKTCVDFPGKVYFIPGNHDWYTWGKEGLSRQESLIENYLKQNKTNQAQQVNTYFLPDDGCPGPVDVPLTEDLTMLVVDSHWFLSSGRKAGVDFNYCENSTIKDYEKSLEEAFSRNEDKQILLVTHHPPFTYGKHGGYYQTKFNIFPLSQIHPNLLIPLPFSGLIANRFRAYISEQDTKHYLYSAYRRKILELALNHGRTIVASGHEHNLQYIVDQGVPFIVSGSGSKKSEVALFGGSQFGIGSFGFAELRIALDGRTVVRFYALDKDDHLKEVYRSTIPTID